MFSQPRRQDHQSCRVPRITRCLQCRQSVKLDGMRLRGRPGHLHDAGFASGESAPLPVCFDPSDDLRVGLDLIPEVLERLDDLAEAGLVRAGTTR